MAATEERRAWVTRVLGINPGGRAPPVDSVYALSFWQNAVDSAVGDLNDVIDAVRETGDQDATSVEIVLKSIVKNLTRTPETPQAVAELQRYLETDDVITAAEAVPAEYGSLDLRAPLLAALSGLAA